QDLAGRGLDLRRGAELTDREELAAQVGGRDGTRQAGVLLTRERAPAHEHQVARHLAGDGLGSPRGDATGTTGEDDDRLALQRQLRGSGDGAAPAGDPGRTASAGPGDRGGGV